MWLCFNNAFISVVADRNNSQRLLVRARRIEHLKNLFGSDTQILTGAGSDYKYRTFVARSVVADLARETLLKIDYDNFKNSVLDETLHGLYADFWDRHYEIQV
jgi:hypothetical protein